MNYKIMLSVIFVILVITIIFAYSMDLYIQIYDPDWHGIIDSSHSIDSTKEKIFIIGSSNIYSINATKINEKISNQQKSYLIYNLADMSDNPVKRLNSIDNVISHKPKIVLYGVGIWEFQKFEPKSYSFSDFLLEPRDFFEFLFEITMDSTAREQIPSSPKDRSLTLLKYILRGPDQDYHPFIKFLPTQINSYEKIVEDYGIPDSNGLDLNEENKQIIALNKILNKLQNNNIKVILFTIPQHNTAISAIETFELENFQEVLNVKSNEFDIPIYFLHDEYSNLDIWRENFHIAIHPDAEIYTNDISKIILKELEE